MSKYIPGNHKHLTVEDRLYIEHSLDAGSSFKDIARYLCKDPSTISKEIRSHRLSEYYSGKGFFFNAHNFCVHRYHCLIDNAEKDRQKLEKDKKVFRSLVEKSAVNLYKKEKGKLHAEYLAKRLLLSGYVAWITFFLLFVTVLSAIRQKIFWGDLTVFLEALRQGILIPADRINHFSRRTADITKGTEQPILSSVLWWIIRIGIPLSVVILIILMLVILIKRYGRDLWKKGINKWNCSLSAMTLCLFVFCGDYVKMVMPFNLVIIWVILNVMLIGIAWYRYVCDKYRGIK